DLVESIGEGREVPLYRARGAAFDLTGGTAGKGVGVWFLVRRKTSLLGRGGIVRCGTPVDLPFFVERRGVVEVSRFESRLVVVRAEIVLEVFELLVDRVVRREEERRALGGPCVSGRGGLAGAHGFRRRERRAVRRPRLVGSL